MGGGEDASMARIAVIVKKNIVCRARELDDADRVRRLLREQVIGRVRASMGGADASSSDA